MRDERQRQIDLARRLDAAALAVPPGSARFVGSVTTGGTIPTCTPCIYILNPVQLGGSESEGGSGSPAVDTTRQVPVVVLGTAPSAGDLLTAFAAGGRWVAEKGSGPAGTWCGCSCSACGGIHFTGGTVTDANGTGIPFTVGANPVDGSCLLTSGIFAWTPGQQFTGSTSNSDCVTGTSVVGHYYYQISCSFNQLHLGILFTDCIADPAGTQCSGYVGYRMGFAAPGSPFGIYATPDCSNDPLTQTFSVPPSGSLNPPSATVSVSLDIEQPGTGPCNCGTNCSACGGVRIVNPYTATWTSICTHSGSGSTAYDPFLNPFNSPFWFTGTPSVDPPPIFRMGVACTVGGGLVATIAEPSDIADIYFAVWSSTLVASDIDCTSGTISATFTTWTMVGTPSLCFGTPGTLSVQLAVESPEHRTCCVPCGIPQKDLTLTISGVATTLTYNGSANWSDGTYTLSCAGGTVALSGGGAWTPSTGYTCSPLHLVFTDGGTTANVDE